MIQAFKMALKSIAGNKFRAFLTMLGIIIGVMALVILVSLVDGATSTVTNTISDLGNNLLTVSISDDKGVPLTLNDLEQWMDTPGIGQIAAAGSTSATGKYGASNARVQVNGVTPAYAAVNDLKLMLGRFLLSSDVKNHTNICIINESAAKELVGYTDCLGEEIALNGMRFTVVGILEDNENDIAAALTGSNLIAFIPYTTLFRLTTNVSSQVSTFYASAEEGTDLDTAEAAMKELLMDRFDEDEDAFHIYNQKMLEQAMGDVTTILTVLLGGIAAISLVVGGIGIMNIMLVTVTERTREIGIRKAIGAGRYVILQQFLLESVVLCLLGCSIGVFLSWVVLRLVSVVTASLNLVFVLETNVVVLAVVFCFIIGVIFGLYPANKAAKMPPIDALHYGG